ncbi:membrane-bound lytic murein transglycosylase MltF [Shimwellia blattae]|uniref:Membrane-bound lytic murein transglycosylase F n=1 Tax=Shimwellia blattae (strain ATCC 29907 / DSM 4481 / JCM 1650 / NBRC 105725 / CDC 9005-74) TaxID=630626 RepID=I2B6G3_SHIBC|nr:membrane-bound lytic murein transglycosylase MltF [Shimwellia blattae]AFJ46117.1 putative transglycosylase [Shimwellia blattae DSM 4481 = NBRC 105725]GAB81239.1 membrane-bound lytic murein transglycosylase F [Shimwellia blattae DSM 4481 = NBRC 105725]VDY63589.1 Membrane-bound lytic murein transglycosylase F precursor [Shimwellia blattae]VEC21621.1 Membrane-bound lytic murein transglycosylase F precursor [Shimwellia blattae]
MKKLKVNYLLTAIVAALLALALWPAVSWMSPDDNRIAAIQSRGELRISTVSTPLTWSRQASGETGGLDYELARRFAAWLGVKLRVTVRDNISQVFDDLDSDRADLLAAGLVYNHERSQSYRPGPAFYSVSQQVVYRVGNKRPRTLEDIAPGQLAVAPGTSAISQLEHLKATRYPALSWQVLSAGASSHLLRQVADGELDYTIADSVAIAIFQRIHPQIAVAMDITDEQPVTWFSRRDNDDSLSAALLGFFNNVNGSGVLARLEEKYLGHVGGFDYVDTRTFLRSVDSVLPELQPLFEKYAAHFDWHMLAAVSYQESHWDAQASSPTGVRGLMMLTRNTAQSLGVSDRLDAEQSIRGGAQYLQEMISKVPETVPEGERIWFALAAYNMGYAHMLDARALTAKQKGNPDSWADVKNRLPLLSQKKWYSKTTYGYARGHEAYAYVENIRKYHQSLVGYLQERQKKAAASRQLAGSYPVVNAEELLGEDRGSLFSVLFSPYVAFGKNHSAARNTAAPAHPQ